MLRFRCRGVGLRRGYDDLVNASRYAAIAKTAVAGIVVLGGGTLGYMLIEGVGLEEAFYMTTITVTTIGFSEVFPLSHAGRVFTIVLAFAGVGVILLIAGEFGRIVLESDLRRVIGMRRDLKMRKKLSHHIVVCGYGRMGRAVVEVLRERKVPFVVVEARSERCTELEELDVVFVQGDATEEAVLRAANGPAASTLIACLADDAHNVFSILLARQLNPEITIIARAVEEGSEERLRLAGADRVINPYKLGGMRLAFTALKPTVMDFIEASLPGTGVELELAEITVSPHSELAGQTLAGADVRRRFGIIVVALKRAGRATFNPAPDELIEPGDVVVALGPPQALDRTEKASASRDG